MKSFLRWLDSLWLHEKILYTIILLAIIVTVYAMIQISDNQERLMQQCMEDGHKEYECVSMLKSNSNTTPVVVPMSNGITRY